MRYSDSIRLRYLALGDRAAANLRELVAVLELIATGADPDTTRARVYALARSAYETKRELCAIKLAMVDEEIAAEVWRLKPTSADDATAMRDSLRGLFDGVIVPDTMPEDLK